MGISALIFGTLKLCGLVGVNAETQSFGQDSHVHGESGYGDDGSVQGFDGSTDSLLTA
jgi:hypothetical protein